MNDLDNKKKRPFRIIFKYSPYRKKTTYNNKTNQYIGMGLDPYWKSQFNSMFAKW